MDHYGIMDIAGNMLDWFDDPVRAEETFSAMCAQDQTVELVLLGFDQDGKPVDTVRATHGMFSLNDSPWVADAGEFHQPLAPGARGFDRLVGAGN